MAKKWIIANWKMNLFRADSIDLVMSMKKLLPSNTELQNLDYRVVLCPPVSLLSMVSTLCEDSMLMVGGQDCHSAISGGAHTGCVSAEMLADIGASLIILGHSECRARGDTNAIILAKTEATIQANLLPVLCVGEDVQARAIGKAKEMVQYQLLHTIPREARNIIIAYEPVWAIGTGKNADELEITQMFESISLFLERSFPNVRFALCYGGSVTDQNAKDLLTIENCNGFLIGKASLELTSFVNIIEAIQ